MHKFIILIVSFFPFSLTASVDNTPKPQMHTVAPQEIGVCVGKGGLTNYEFWGPVGASCNGLAEWGVYVNPFDEPVKNICSCVGDRNNTRGVTFWGPKGQSCVGVANAKRYDGNCMPLNSVVIASCVGRGGLNGQRLYGPKQAPCAGFPEWGVYD